MIAAAYYDGLPEWLRTVLVIVAVLVFVLGNLWLHAQKDRQR